MGMQDNHQMRYWNLPAYLYDTSVDYECHTLDTDTLSVFWYRLRTGDGWDRQRIYLKLL